MKNQKLAESVGWHWERYEVASGAFSRVLLAPDERLEEGHIGYIPDHTPNFTQSLGACFKWLVPKVLEEHTIIETYSFRQKSGLYYSETEIWDEGETEHGFTVLKGKFICKAFAQDLDLEKANASALCLAIEKLEDAEKGG